MGISTIQSYHGAQVFEAIGLNQAFIDEYFTWTASRIGGIGLDEIARDVQERQARARSPSGRCRRTASIRAASTSTAASGEFHLFNPVTIHKLQHACRTGDYKRVQGVLAR